MIIIDSPSNDAYFNIASEEYLLKKYPEEEIFLLYVNAPSIIVGRFQNTMAEINIDYVTENNIKVVRRMSGGGAVYHDLGNLNFSFHTAAQGEDFSDFKKFTQPVVDLLQSLNVPAELKGRNDLLVEDKKFSGNAKLAKNGKIIQHGTILINSEMKVLGDALKINPLKYKDKAVKSNRARVTNLLPYLPANLTVESFKKLLIDYMLEYDDKKGKVYQLSLQEIREIEELSREKYSTWNWNYGISPAYGFNKAIKVDAGFIEVHLDVKNGVILDAKIFGDFFASKSIHEFEDLLKGERHEVENIKRIMRKIPLKEYFGDVNVDDVVDLFS